MSASPDDPNVAPLHTLIDPIGEPELYKLANDHANTYGPTYVPHAPGHGPLNIDVTDADVAAAGFVNEHGIDRPHDDPATSAGPTEPRTAANESIDNISAAHTEAIVENAHRDADDAEARWRQAEHVGGVALLRLS